MDSHKYVRNILSIIGLTLLVSVALADSTAQKNSIRCEEEEVAQNLVDQWARGFEPKENIWDVTASYVEPNCVSALARAINQKVTVGQETVRLLGKLNRTGYFFEIIDQIDDSAFRNLFSDWIQSQQFSIPTSLYLKNNEYVWDFFKRLGRQDAEFAQMAKAAYYARLVNNSANLAEIQNFTFENEPMLSVFLYNVGLAEIQNTYKTMKNNQIQACWRSYCSKQPVNLSSKFECNPADIEALLTNKYLLALEKISPQQVMNECQLGASDLQFMLAVMFPDRQCFGLFLMPEKIQTISDIDALGACSLENATRHFIRLGGTQSNSDFENAYLHNRLEMLNEGSITSSQDCEILRDLKKFGGIPLPNFVFDELTKCQN